MAHIDNTARISERADSVQGPEITSAAEERPGAAASHLHDVSIVVLAVSLVLLPLFFGGINEVAALSSQISLCLAAALLLIFKGGVPSGLVTFSRSPATALITFCFFSLLGYLALQFLVMQSRSTPHPILGSSGALANTQAFFISLSEIIFCAATFLVARAVIEQRSNASKTLVKAIIVSGLAASAIALSHWFYDNGKLFWNFAPKSVFISERARWPFVNSNHLGDFLLAPALFLIALLLARPNPIFGASKPASSAPFRYPKKQQVIKSVFTYLFLGSAIMCLLIALLASLSRGAWLGFSLALLLMLACNAIMSRSARRPIRAAALIPTGYHPAAYDRYRGAKFITPGLEMMLARLKRWSRPLTLLVALSLLAFFLSDRGSELIAGRIEFGLKHTKDDIRWTFYGDTLQMLKDHLWFGVGLGNWSSVYPAYMSPSLAGILPAYLHSDPLQLFVELGLIGSLPILVATVGVSYFTFRALGRAVRADTAASWLILPAYCAAAALFIASLPEFPLRMPAIVLQITVVVALLAWQIDRTLSGFEKGDSEEGR
ncbi:MAG: O-antigen ligase family protein [Deltaproteobacteria bacterium]|nr:O-antigen ligase family protein [Deltaproteobacteria bacterium]